MEPINSNLSPAPYPDPDRFNDADDYALAVQIHAAADVANTSYQWAIGGTAPEETSTEAEYGIEPRRGAEAVMTSDDLYDMVAALDDSRRGARIVTRLVTYGPWRYVTPEELTHG